MLANDFSPEAAGAVMRRLSKLSARFIGEHGFSIGVDDVTPALRLLQEKQATIDSSYQECEVSRCTFCQLLQTCKDKKKRAQVQAHVCW